MAAQTKIVITHDKEVAVDLKAALQSTSDQGEKGSILLQTYLNKLASGSAMGSMSVLVDDGAGAAAAGTVTFSSIANNDTVTIMGVVFTAKTSGASGAAQFNIGGSDTAAGTNFAAAINAHASFTGVLTASAASGVTTLTCSQRGIIGNGITLAISAHGSVSAAAMAGGTASASGVLVSYTFGV